MKIQISFEFRKKIRYVFNENIDQLCVQKNQMYLMKIQINFVFRKIKFVFNENTDQF